MQQLAILNPEHATPEEIKQYAMRKAARAVIIDDQQCVALLHVTTANYYKLPGGGIEPNETIEEALHRECWEETGSKIEIIQEIGSVTEYRKMYELTQISYCYLAKVIGEKGIPEFTPDEQQDGFEIVWLSYDQALKVISDDANADDEGRRYIVPRDLLFLQTASLVILEEANGLHRGSI